ncbi:hypothetical protein GCM10010145_32000 [Streptomyces ruber]|uniref:UDP-glucose:sterol glucosyltransferase n=2 Tax=Streptomyces TaxID=1883 RepID=A0A918BCX0_9ACTN|nr:glycosyltransferase [Streptomyces ruber]GGQ59620.1 hypothetical protein GCM10010145_32000 [Streptomyces ruber]
MTAGSRGDVAPYTGLGHGLARAGHEVTLVTHERFTPLVSGSGVRFHALPVDPREELHSERGRALHRSSSGAGKLIRLARMARALVERMTDDLVTAARRADVLLVSAPLAPLGHALAEGLALPSMGVYLQPTTPTREFAPPMIGSRSWGPVANRVSARGANLLNERLFDRAVRGLRLELGLPPAGTGTGIRARDRQSWPVYHGFSPLVVPRPGDWRTGLHVTGYWWPYDREGGLPGEVRDFLEAGAPPVFVGLGSATVPDAGRLSEQVVRALRAAGLRGVIQRGWGGLSAAGDDMLTIGEVPHSLLFPHMAAVVHHAGAGTTAAGLRAGVPAVPVPVQFDENFWAARLTALGVAPRAVPLRGLTTRALAEALRRATGDSCHARHAHRLAERLRAEDGVAPVLHAVERVV